MRGDRERASPREVDSGSVVVPEEVADGLSGALHTAVDAELNPRVRVQFPAVRHHSLGLWESGWRRGGGEEGIMREVEGRVEDEERVIMREESG